MLSQVGHYDVLGHVADSSDGGLWQGRDTGLDRLVALKQVDDPASPAAQRLRGEARTLAGISHPHVVSVYELVENTDGVWLVEEWVNGHPLTAVAAHAGRLTPAQAVGVVRDALQGLAHTHAQGIVHGDVTPSNILVDESGTSKLIDFGLARPAGEALSAGTGSPGFISPQLAQGSPATPADDVYAAGALLVSLLTNRPAFAGTTSGAVLAAQLDARPDLTGIPGHTRNVLFTAVHPDAGQRYTNAAEFLAALEEAATRDLGPGWLAEAGVAALVTTAGVGIATTVVSAGATPPAEQPHAAASSRSKRRGAHGERNGIKLAARASLKGAVAAGMVGVVTTASAAALSVVLARHEASAAGAISGTQVAALAGAVHIAAPLPSLGGGAAAAGVSSPSPAPVVGSASPAPTSKSTSPTSGTHVAAPTPSRTSAEPSSAGAAPSRSAPTTVSPTKALRASGFPASGGIGAAPSSTAPTTSSGASSSPGTGIAGADTDFATNEPFNGCDETGTQWTLNGLVDERPGTCVSGETPISSADGTYGFATTTALADVPAFGASNEATVSGSLPGLPDDHQRVLGIAEGNASVGYFVSLRNDGTWGVNPVTGLGTASVALQSQLATGQIPFVAGTDYSISLSIGSAGLTVTIGPSASASPSVTQTVPIAAFTPTVVGFGCGTGDPVAPLNPADFYTDVSTFDFTNN